jgi:vacuolar-type H+-ATPase subunit I/STV1
MAGEGISPISIFILLIGNVLVIVLETLVSLLHSLRLQWVEFFSKLGLSFDGYKYEPFIIKRELTAVK